MRSGRRAARISLSAFPGGGRSAAERNLQDVLKLPELFGLIGFFAIFVQRITHEQLAEHQTGGNRPEIHQNELYSGRLQPGERLPAEQRLADMLGVGRAHVRAAFQKLEFYGIVQTFPRAARWSRRKMQVLERMITDALRSDSTTSRRWSMCVLLEIEAIKLCARNRTAEDLENIERALEKCEAKFYTDERVSKDFAYHQALARGAQW